MEEEFFKYIRENAIDCDFSSFVERTFSTNNLKPGKDVYPYIGKEIFFYL
jgi:hypothetical protein